MRGGGGVNPAFCVTHYPLNFNFSLYTLLFAFLTFLRLKFLVIASLGKMRSNPYIQNNFIFSSLRETRQRFVAIHKRKGKLNLIDCHAKNRSRLFLLAMTDKTANALHCHTEALCRSIHKKLKSQILSYGYFATLNMTIKGYRQPTRHCETCESKSWQSIKFILWIAALVLLARNDTHFYQKFNIFHTFYPKFRSAKIDKYNFKGQNMTNSTFQTKETR